jgi:hypothetical protein
MQYNRYLQDYSCSAGHKIIQRLCFYVMSWDKKKLMRDRVVCISITKLTFTIYLLCIYLFTVYLATDRKSEESQFYSS